MGTDQADRKLVERCLCTPVALWPPEDRQRMEEILAVADHVCALFVDAFRDAVLSQVGPLWKWAQPFLDGE